MLQKLFNDVYTKFKLHFYQRMFERLQERETSLTTVETFCMEIIYTLKNPTINEFARLANLSGPNAAYKVSSLMKKGYLRKVQSQEDRREYHLEVTEKYLDYYNISYQYVGTVVDRMKNRFTAEELEVIERALTIMRDELMMEVKY